MERGFIKAEVYAYDDLMQYKSESEMKVGGDKVGGEKLYCPRWRYNIFQVQC